MAFVCVMLLMIANMQTPNLVLFPMTDQAQKNKTLVIGVQGIMGVNLWVGEFGLGIGMANEEFRQYFDFYCHKIEVSLFTFVLPNILAFGRTQLCLTLEERLQPHQSIQGAHF